MVLIIVYGRMEPKSGANVEPGSCHFLAWLMKWAAKVKL